MKIKIESDVFDIVKRVKEIDDGYFIVYDTDKLKFELHNYYQFNTYCLTIPFDDIDDRILELIYLSSVTNIDKIIEDIDKNNIAIENNNTQSMKEYGDYILREIYAFANNSSKEYNVQNAFSSIWR